MKPSAEVINNFWVKEKNGVNNNINDMQLEVDEGDKCNAWLNYICCCCCQKKHRLSAIDSFIEENLTIENYYEDYINNMKKKEKMKEIINKSDKKEKPGENLLDFDLEHEVMKIEIEKNYKDNINKNQIQDIKPEDKALIIIFNQI